MIRRLRWKYTATTMVLLTAMLIIILVFVHQSAGVGLRNDSMAALRAAQSELSGGHKRPGIKGRTTHNPCFILEERPDGSLVTIGSERYDLSNKEELLQILEKASETRKQNGILKQEQLRFLKLEDTPGNAYAFMDISAEIETMNRLTLTCMVIFLVGMVGLSVISLLLAWWAVRPVEKAWGQQRQFVADASHELKTPLTVILTNAELLNDSNYDSDSKDRFASNILTMSRQMRGLVEELLDQARVDNGVAQAKRARLNLSKLAEDALLPFEPVYFEAGRSLESHIQPELFVNGSEVHLLRVVEVLLDNGCKYSYPGGTVTLRLIRQGRNCLLTVTSPGAAMTPEQCRDIFKRFYRVDSARSMNHSFGLGLPIAQGIVEQHRGKIWAESKDGYNTFFVTLPLNG